MENNDLFCFLIVIRNTCFHVSMCPQELLFLHLTAGAVTQGLSALDLRPNGLVSPHSDSVVLISEDVQTPIVRRSGSTSA